MCMCVSMFSVYWRVALDVKREEREKENDASSREKITIEADMKNTTAYNNASSTSNKQVSLVKREKMQRNERKKKEEKKRKIHDLYQSKRVLIVAKKRVFFSTQ